jgi:MSHA biogenesis protein MshP
MWTTRLRQRARRGFAPSAAPRGGRGVARSFARRRSGGFAQSFARRRSGGFAESFARRRSGGFAESFARRRSGGFAESFARRRSCGFAMASAVFILVALAALAAAITLLTTRTETGQAVDIIGSRAYQAARTGLEWGAYQVLDPLNATATSASAPLPNCPGVALAAACPTAASPSSTTLPAGPFSSTVLSGTTVTVQCHCADFTESGRNVRVFQLRSTATYGSGFSAVERQLSARVSYCRDPGGSAATQPPYGCI